MSFTSSEEDRTKENERDRQMRDLQATVVAMREALELAEREADERLQAATAQLSAEGEQLRAMITALREELESQQQRHGEELQQQKLEATDEGRQLHATIHALRAELEEKGR